MAQKEDHIVVQKLGVAVGNDAYTPRERTLAANLRNIGLARLHLALKHVVAALLNLVGYGRIVALEGRAAVGIVEIHARVRHQVRLRDADLAVAHVHQHRQEHQAVGTHLAHRFDLVGVLERVVVLLLDALVGIAANVRAVDVVVTLEGELRNLVLHRIVALARRDETVSRSVVIGAELNGIVALELKRQRRALVLDLGLLVERGLDSLVDLADNGLAQARSLAPRLAVADLHGYLRGRQNSTAVGLNAPAYVIGDGHRHHEFAVRRGDSLHRRLGLDAQCGAHGQHT